VEKVQIIHEVNFFNPKYDLDINMYFELYNL